MRKTMVSALTAAMVIGGSTLAMAAAPERETFELRCDNGETYTVEVNGNGDFTPGRAVDSTAVLIPVSFGDFMFRAELPDGTIIEETFPGGDSKGKGNVAERNPRPTTTCTFEDTLVLEEEQDGFPAGTELTFGGTVTVHVAGGR